MALSGSRHVIDRSGRIGLARGKRTVNVIAYRLFLSPVKDLRYAAANHINQQYKVAYTSHPGMCEKGISLFDTHC